MDSGEEADVLELKGKKKKRYHRHTPRQIQELESVFKMCPHPDEKQRMQLSRDLGLEPRQIKFWFQNRRTQMKSQHERADNCALRADNDRMRCENITMTEALKNIICPSCGTLQASEDSFFDGQKLRLENARLKEELDRVSAFATKYLGRPITPLPPIQQTSVSSLDLTVGGYDNPGFAPSLDLGLFGARSPSMSFTFPTVSETERPMMVELATRSMEELIRLAQTDESLWNRFGSDGREILNLESYERLFPRPPHHIRTVDTRIESSRELGDVIMNSLALVDMFMDSGKWMELFPTVVSNARTIEVLLPGIHGSRSGALVLMYAEFLGLSPVIPSRELCFLRYCQQIEPGFWIISDISIHSPKVNFIPCTMRRLPSGCLIQDMPNGYSKIVWVEHVEVEEKNPVHHLYHDLVESGIAFGAQRWVGALQRMCERIQCLIVAANSPKDMEGDEGRRSMMRLSQRMVSNFCSILGSSNGYRCAAPAGLNDAGIRVTAHKCSDPGQPSGVFLSASTSIWLPFPPQAVFSFLRDERSRSQTSPNPSNPYGRSMLILQESCTDPSCSLVVHASVDIPSINIAMGGEDSSFVPLLPSGFVVLPDGRPSGGSVASSSSNPGGRSSGSVLTVAFQIMVNSLPTSTLNLESVATVNRLVDDTVQRIKASFGDA
ncbi:Homeobox-leucine zipper protein ROC8 [Platanthera guangdongensis]|uniref:Homeobox-leucine zipper protein ROC8 n=1 Tax=Platanthera guangdongensis TaxID=2320717 RepID=A0ABR2N421_9ASPA